MAWLSGLADKAENLLNKIDQNTAAVLSKENKYEIPQAQLTEVAWISSSSSENGMNHSNLELPKHFPTIRSSPSLQNSVSNTYQEDELLTYLNTPSVSPKRIISSAMSSPTPSSLVVECPTNTDSISEISNGSRSSSPILPQTSIPTGDKKQHENGLDNDDSLSNIPTDQQDVESTGNIENGHHNVDERLNTLQDNYDSKDKNVMINDFIKSSKDQFVKRHIKEIEKNLHERDVLIGKQETDHQKEIIMLNDKLKSVESEKMQLSKQLMDLQVALERSRADLNANRSELEQHRARALKTLQEKEKLIAELKSNTSKDVDDATVMEMNQLRQEREALREENQQVCEQLRLVREELSNTEMKLEKLRQKSAEANVQAQDIINTERRRRLEAEEDARLHSEELRSLKDEIIRQRNSYSLQLQKQNTEITRLRSQLSATSTPSSEVESRLSSLTQTLVMKQQALENLTTERNALRLQLEKLELEFRNMKGNARRNLLYNNMNDTDDAKAQVPTFLIETPFDTGVTRRVKRAYSLLDAISVRTGVFLRRYPLARILVLTYMALLQFWVLIVLFSQSPEAH